MLGLGRIHLCVRILDIKIAHEAPGVVSLTHSMALLAQRAAPLAINTVPCLQAEADLVSTDKVGVGLLPATMHAISLLVPLGEWLQNHGVLGLGRLNQVEKILGAVVHAVAGVGWLALARVQIGRVDCVQLLGATARVERLRRRIVGVLLR